MAVTLKSLLDSVEEDVHAKSFSHSTILRYLNEAVLRTAGKFQLPDLAQVGTVTTSTTDVKVQLPSDFHHDVQFVQSAATQMRILREKSFVKFLQYYPVLFTAPNQPYFNGNVELVAQRSPMSKWLYYQAVPNVPDTLTVYYFRLPVPMTLSLLTGTVDGIPDDFASGICASYAKWHLWRKIEQDETRGSNSAMYHAEFDQTCKDMSEYFGPPDEAPSYVSDELFRDYGFPGGDGLGMMWS